MYFLLYLLYNNKIMKHKEQEIYDALNEYTELVIKDTLNTAAEKATIKFLIDEENDIVEEANINKESIINTFDITYKKYSVK